jgi:1,4-alpha-glucan branching enzyme
MGSRTPDCKHRISLAPSAARGDETEIIERFRQQIVLMVTMIRTKRRAKSAAPATGAAGIEAPRAAAPRAAQVSLELIKPEAKNVFVAGSFNEWKPETTPLVRRGDGRWAGDLAVKPGRHEYLFVVDGQWLPDPNAKESVVNPFGGKNSVLVVSE